MSLPFLNTAPARTSATRWGALTARHRVCADSMSLNAIATPAAREPGPLVTRWRSLTVAKGGLDRVGGAQVNPVLGGVVVEGKQHVPQVLIIARVSERISVRGRLMRNSPRPNRSFRSSSVLG